MHALHKPAWRRAVEFEGQSAYLLSSPCRRDDHQKGIPVASIPVGAFRKAQSQDFSIRKGGSKSEAFKKLCYDTKEVLDKCTKGKKVSGT